MLFCPLESVVYHHEDAVWQEGGEAVYAESSGREVRQHAVDCSLCVCTVLMCGLAGALAGLYWYWKSGLRRESARPGLIVMLIRKCYEIPNPYLYQIISSSEYQRIPQ